MYTTAHHTESSKIRSHCCVVWTQSNFSISQSELWLWCPSGDVGPLAHKASWGQCAPNIISSLIAERSARSLVVLLCLFCWLILSQYYLYKWKLLASYSFLMSPHSYYPSEAFEFSDSTWLKPLSLLEFLASAILPNLDFIPSTISTLGDNTT